MSSVHPLPRPGRVTLVGAGPGDPELLTVRAVRALQSAQVVLYDNLVSDQVLELIPSSAERIYVGKQDRHHTLPQEEITDLLVGRGYADSDVRGVLGENFLRVARQVWK